MSVGPTILPPLRKPPDLTPQVDDTVRSLLGDSYPESVFLIYLPQRVCHAFFPGDPDDRPQRNIFHWVLAFTDGEIAHSWAAGMAQVRRVGMMWHREPVQLHQHALDEACELTKRLYPVLRGLLIVQRDGRQIRHWVR